MERTAPPFFKRGPHPLARLSFFALLSLLLLLADARLGYLHVLRQGVTVVLYPLERLATAPVTVYGRIRDFFTLQSELALENARLRQRELLLSSELERLAALEAENSHLRQLLKARSRVPGGATVAEILYAQRDPFSRKIIVDKGFDQHIEPGQVVIDDAGVVGQVTRVYPLMSEVTLITDKDQAVPVQVLRTGLRAIVFGSGDGEWLDLRYLPVNVDVQNGDVLVTSGIDGTYPPGLPVATVVKIERNAAYAFARILCAPVAGVERYRQVLILSREAQGPERPAEPEAPAKGPKKGK